ncbi:hypothetical protein CW667_03135 [Candidatus Bathyarchaeota archaeon]|nr:MAG: hypothetical protein CW667_03135 [Candidatus Bathyarchaeota archaeon]
MYFDIAMPLTLFVVSTASALLAGKVERKLKSVLEEKEFSVKEAVFLVAAISVTVSLIVLVPQMAVMAIFLFSYSMLLFIFTYVFSDFQKTKAKLFSTTIFLTCLTAAIVSLFTFNNYNIVAYGAIALLCLSAFTFITLLYEENRVVSGERWYLAILPPALFILLYMFYSGTPIWFPYLLNMYGVIFAILITLYLGSLFTWKTTMIFIGLLTVMDIILVLFTGTMVSAAMHISSLRLPVLVSVPTIPVIITERGTVYMSLGLGDFFFAGLIGIQSLRKYGKQFALLSLVAMSISFFIFETILLNYKLGAFPGTLMIICGWLPLVAFKKLKH